MHKLLEKKHTGILLPLFSMYEKDDFGCGDISGLSNFIDFIKDFNIDVIQILPINEMPPGTSCPYTALSAFAIDPVYVSVKEIENLSPQILKKIKSKEFKNRIKSIKQKKYIDYDEIKKIKYEILWEQYEYLLKEDSSLLNRKLERYTEENNYWIDDYAIFRTLKDKFNWQSWTYWPDEYKNYNREALERFKNENIKEVNFFKYIQLEIDRQFSKIKDKLEKYSIHLLGDIPFMVNQESHDIWSRQYDFRIDMECGAPPDAFSKEGQRWGLPAPNWESQKSNNYEWWRLKLKRFEKIYDIFRIDHVVGFFRTWVIPKDGGQPNFDILNPQEQEERGRHFLKQITSYTSMLAIAEDLGVIPDYVRKVMKELNICGYKILRWEKDKDGYYINPENFDEISLATLSTHDTETMSQWWKKLDPVEKNLFFKMIYGKTFKTLPNTYRTFKNDLIKKLFSAPSKFVILTLQDIIASEDRINTPATVGPHNWSYRLKYDYSKLYQKYRDDFDFISKTAKELR